MAKDYKITQRQHWDTLSLRFLAWTLHGVKQTNKKELQEIRANLQYHYDVRRVVRCVQKEWGTVMLLPLPTCTIGMISMDEFESTMALPRGPMLCT